jgi:signal transduction histidine kinase
MVVRQVHDNDLITKVVPMLLAWAGGALFYSGAAALQERRAALKWPLLACVPCLAGYLWFGWVAPEFWLRPLFYTPPVVIFLALGARELFREKRSGLLLASRFTACATLIYALAFMFRCWMLIASLANPEPLLGSAVQVMIFASTLLWILCWTFATVLLINQRQNLEKMVFHDEQLRASKKLAIIERELAAERAQRQRSLLLRDLHDGLGGVTANLVLLASLGRNEQTSPERNELMIHIEHLAVECNREVRLLMDTLQKGAVDWRQFLQELREYAKHLAAGHRFTLHWHVAGHVPAQPITDLAAQLSLMRCLKEAFNNVARHSCAREAHIRVRFLNNCLGVIIRDDGVGISLRSENESSGRGLHNMLRRCEELGGRVTFRRGIGTVLHFLVPLPVVLIGLASPPVSGLASVQSQLNQKV